MYRSLFYTILRELLEESNRLYVTGPKSDDARIELTDILRSAVVAYREYAVHTANEERIGG